MASDALFPFVTGEREYPLGSDIAGITAIDYALSTVSGRVALAHAVLRRLTTPRGGLWYSPTYGFAIVTCIGSALPEGVIEQRALEQILLEEEVEDATCDVTFEDVAGVRTVRLDISIADADGPFDLTLTASELTITALLEGVEIFSEAA